MVLSPPAYSVQLSPSLALQFSQRAQDILQKTPGWKFWSAWSSSESAELWMNYENLVLSCLRTGDDKSAHTCLQRLIERFGADHERVVTLTEIYKEATAQNESELKGILEEYDLILSKDPSNIPLSKRRIALLKSLGKSTEAITALNKFLDSWPNNTEAWAELSDLYVREGMYQHSVFALEEILLISPYSWNTHVRLGEVLYMAASYNSVEEKKFLIDSLRSFCRSIELCDDYLRGYYGLKMVTKRLLQFQKPTKSDLEGNSNSSQVKNWENLEKLATAKLGEIVRRKNRAHMGGNGSEEAEVLAAKEILEKEPCSRAFTC